MRWEEPATSTLDPTSDPSVVARGTPAVGDANANDADVGDPESRQLGRGAGGTVLRGKDRHLPRVVAWKIARGTHPRRRLEHEARVLAALEHPSIVPIHDLVDEPDGSLRIALRLVRGETLHTLIRKTPELEARLRVLRPFLQAVEAVAWAHRLGWVHRDLKPANLMIGEFGETQVIDWGLALNVDESGSALDPPGAVVGTVATMSPEQARGEQVDATADVWGLGATLFELISTQPLFRDAPPRELLERVRMGGHERLVDVCPDAPPELCAIVERCLALRPEERYPDARALAADLGAYLDGRRVLAHEYSSLELLWRFVRAWRLPLGIALAVLITGAIAGVLAYRGIGLERDEAIAARSQALAALAQRDEEIAAAGIIEAQRELVDGQRPESEQAAARTLSVRESPEARGVIAAFLRTERFERRWRRAMPLACIDLDVAPDGGAVLCGNRETLALVRADRVVWRRDVPYRDATFTDGGASVVVIGHDSAVAELAASDGHVIDAWRSDGCLGNLRRDPLARIAMNVGHACADLVGPRAPLRIDPCGRTHIEVLALDASGRSAGLCAGGDLFVRAADGATRRVPTPIGLDADTLLSAALLEDTLVVGSSRGEIQAIDLATGGIRVRHTIEPLGAVIALVASPSDARLVARVEGQGPLLMHARTLAPIARLPRSDGRFARFVAGPAGAIPELVSYDVATSTLSGWYAPAALPARLEGLAGVTHIAPIDAERLLVTHDSSARLMDPRDGRFISEQSWVEVIAKSAILVGDEVRVATAGRVGGEPLGALVQAGAGHETFREMAAMRRIATLSRDRMIGARTGLGLNYWKSSVADPVRVIDVQLTDLAVRDDVAVALTDAPRTLVSFDVGNDPVELGRCAVPSTLAVALGAVPAGWREPLVYAVSPTAIVAYRVSDCAILAAYAAPQSELTHAAASGDGRFIAAGTREGTVLVWHTDGPLAASVPFHIGAVTALVIDDAGRFLYSGAWDGRVATLALDVLDTPREDLVHAIRRAW